MDVAWIEWEWPRFGRKSSAQPARVFESWEFIEGKIKRENVIVKRKDSLGHRNFTISS